MGVRVGWNRCGGREVLRVLDGMKVITYSDAKMVTFLCI